MGVDYSPDIVATSKPLDSQPQELHPQELHPVGPANALGGQLLVSPEAGKSALAGAVQPASTDAGSAAPTDAGRSASANAGKSASPDSASHGAEKPASREAGTPPSTDAGTPPSPDSGTAPASDSGKTPAPDAQQQAYDQIHGQYEKEAKAYWDKVAAAKKIHQFVMEFPPIYSGPDKPKTPGQPPAIKPNSVPTINQMLDDSKHLNQFAAGDKTKPDFDLRQVSEFEFKQRYAQEALRIGQQYGVSSENVRNIVRSIYAFEDGGWGTHETLSNMPPSLVKDDKPGETTIQDARRNFHAAGPTGSSALGYNQLMMANTLENIDQQSKPITNRLEQLAQENPARAADLRAKSAMVTSLSVALDKELMAMANADKAKKPSEQKKYLDSDGKPTELLYTDFEKSTEPTASGLSRQDMARAVHALNLDGDIGPIIQAQELGNLLRYADRYGYQSLLQGKEQTDKQAVAAYDGLSADQKAKAVHEILDLVKSPTTTAAAKNSATTVNAATAAANHAATNSATTAADGAPGKRAADQSKEDDFNLTKEALEKKLLALQPGVDDSLAKDKLSQHEADMLSLKVLALRDFGQPTGVLSPQAQELLTKVAQSYYGGLSAEKLMPAALELANLAGPKNAQQMVDAHNQNVPTVNFFSRAGYEGNPVTNRRTGAELLLQIERSMRGPNNSARDRHGQADFDRAFDLATGSGSPL